MNRLARAKGTQVIAALVEGNSIRATVRMTGVSKNAIQRLLAVLGPACEQYQDRALCNLPCKRVQCDEIWSFCYAKQKNVPANKLGQFGYEDIRTWAALCADTKLICSWKIGARGASTAYALMHDLEARLANRIQLTTDGHRVYVEEPVELRIGTTTDRRSVKSSTRFCAFYLTENFCASRMYGTCPYRGVSFLVREIAVRVVLRS